MDFEQNNTEPSGSPSEPVAPLVQGPPAAEKAKKRTGWRIFWGIILALSVLVNIALFLTLIGVVTVFAAGQRGVFAEEIIRDGPRTTKIALINVRGIIDGEQAQDVYGQLKRAREDKQVKGIILRVNSPGGGISASDRIYNEIRKYRDKEDNRNKQDSRGV